MPAIASSSRAVPARLILEIDARPYQIRKISCDRAFVTDAYRLLSDRGEVYDVAESEHGASCDCPDFGFRREGIDPLGCKHVRALRTCGLLSAPSSRPGALAPGASRG